MCTENRDRGSYCFQRWNGEEWEEWTGHFISEELAQEWYEHPDRGQFFLFGKGYTLGLFYCNRKISPEWMNPNSMTNPLIQ